MSNPNNPIQPTNPQDLIDQALGGASTPMPEPSLPTPEPLTPSPSTEPVTAQKTEEASAPSVETVPAELTNAPTEPEPMPELPNDTKPMAEDMPLAFAGAADSTASASAEPSVAAVTEPFVATVPPVLTAPAVDQTSTPKKKKGLKIVGLVVGFFVMFGVVGAVSYSMFGQTGLVAYVTKWIEEGGKIVKNPVYKELQDKGAVTVDGETIDQYENEVKRAKDLGLEEPTAPGQTAKEKGTDQASCDGCFNGSWQVWKNGECRSQGSCGSGVAGKDTPNPNTENAATPADCTRYGGTWCSATDLNGTSYAFCNGTGTGGSTANSCQNLASEKGYVVVKGMVLCRECTANDGPACDGWTADDDKIDYYWDGSNGGPNDPDRQAEVERKVDLQCAAQFKKAPTLGYGEGSFICEVGVEGSGGVVYKAGQACTAANGWPYKGNKKNFCGVIQVDTPNGHMSYSSSGGCDKEEKTTTVTTPTPSPSPSPSGSVSLMCTGLTRTPTTTPKIGDKLTFTCAGSSTPAGAVSLNYKFRYNINSGAYVTLANKTATTAEMTVAACGTYKVQCQTCGTINGVLTCDPVWGSATVQ